MSTINKLAYAGTEYNISAENACFASQFGTGEDGNCTIDSNTYLCAKTYNFKNLTISPNVRVQFYGCGVPVIKVYNCFCNMGCIDLRTPAVIPTYSITCGVYGTYHNHEHTCEIDLCDCGGCGYKNGGNCGQNGGSSTYVGGGAACGCNGGGGAGGPTGRCGDCTQWGECYTGYHGGNATSVKGGDGGDGGTACCGGGNGGGGGYGVCCGGNGGNGGRGGDGGFGWYLGGNGGNGGAGGYGGDGGRGGDSYYGDGGNGGGNQYSWYTYLWGNGGDGGNSIRGNGGNGGDGGDNCNGARCGIGGNGGCTLYGNGGNGGKNTCYCYTGCGGSVFGGMYGLLIIARNIYNNKIIGAGGNGGAGIKGGNGGAGAEIGVFYGDSITKGTITYKEGKGGCAYLLCNRGCDGAKGKLLLSKITI